jgi:hypothetical protein
MLGAIQEGFAVLEKIVTETPLQLQQAERVLE